MYQNDNKGKPAPDLATLVKTQDINDDVTKSPFGPAKNGKDIVLVDYGGRNVAAGPGSNEIAVAYDQAALEQGEGTNVLYADGRVDWVAAESFKKVLEDSKKKAALQNAQP
jgi:prepilin-type processing-associated H-X9-DG protein